MDNVIETAHSPIHNALGLLSDVFDKQNRSHA